MCLCPSVPAWLWLLAFGRCLLAHGWRGAPRARTPCVAHLVPPLFHLQHCRRCVPRPAARSTAARIHAQQPAATERAAVQSAGEGLLCAPAPNSQQCSCTPTTRPAPPAPPPHAQATHTRTHMHPCTPTHRCAQRRVQHISARLHSHKHTCMHARIRTRTHTHARSHTRIRTRMQAAAASSHPPGPNVRPHPPPCLPARHRAPTSPASPRCVCTYIRECVCTYIRECVCTYIRGCVCTYIRECVCTCIRECVCAYMSACAHAYKRVCACLHASVCVCHAHMFAFAGAGARVLEARTHTHTHTPTRTHAQCAHCVWVWVWVWVWVRVQVWVLVYAGARVCAPTQPACACTHSRAYPSPPTCLRPTKPRLRFCTPEPAPRAASHPTPPQAPCHPNDARAHTVHILPPKSFLPCVRRRVRRL